MTRAPVLAIASLLYLSCQKQDANPPRDAPTAPPPSSAPPIVEAAAPPTSTVKVESQPCLRRDEANDANCAFGTKKHFFVWDEHACAIARETIAEVSKRCEAIGPHLSMNTMNWCCP